MKRILLYMALLFISAQVAAQTITKSSGWLESAFVEWSPVAGADSYNVYYTGGGETNKKIDEQLIRSYGTYFRADVLGLAAGSYTVTVKSVTSGVEGAGATTLPLTVLAQDRSGFAFDGGRVPGGYNADGTPKAGAIILYITKNTKNTISFNVVTNNKGGVTNSVGLQNILYGIKKGYETRPFIIRMIGNITDPSVLEGGDIVIENNNNASSYVTLEGVGNDAVANGWGIRLKKASNIEIRNIGLMLTDASEGDNIGLQTDNSYVWVHNCDLFYGGAGGDADQAKGDGALDSKRSTFVTFSYNHFWDTGKSNLLGNGTSEPQGYLTYHHNWYDHSDSRHPRVRTHTVHVYNNYYDGNSKYGAGSTLGSSVFMEANFFRNCKYPMLTSKQGTDIFFDAKGTFSGEAGGTIKAFNNVMSGQTRYVVYDAITNPIEFDAIEVTDKSLPISGTIKSKLGANIYNNFDVNPAIMYAYTPHSAEDAKTNTMLYSGRVEGGDLKYAFNNAIDDSSSDVNVALMSALTSYTTKLVSVQGETDVVGNQTLTSTSKNNDQTVSAGVAISNIVFTWGGDATNASVVGLPNGVTSVVNASAKTITLSGTPTETMEYTVTTTGTTGASASDSGTITVLPASSQVLTVSSNNSSQTIVKGSAIAPIVLTWSGDATDVEITNELADGLNALKDAVAKTITISGTPTATGSTTFTAITSGIAGTPVAVSGTIVVNAVSVGDQIHNFTLSDKTNSFFAISGSNLSNSRGTMTYEGLSLSLCLKLESSAGVIEFDTTQPSTLTLVMNASSNATTFVAGANANIDGVNRSDASGILVITLPAGHHKIMKSGTGNIFYVKLSYSTLGVGDNVKASKLALYPNPVSDQLYISSEDQKVKNVLIYSLSGTVVKNISSEVESIDVSNLATGNYLVKVTTDQGSVTKKIIKK
ncbi:T9SS type A sorting domain-containing protein [Flavobacterium pectinovorum]|uniref:pectate lyase family protein n=1 Tax=Flavobacterium pectinovorum TaxID=29533 RepID=UPI001FAE6335|nr:T9SS type A sorting domain-containing protein [Flavobacterium pectinovorum]MCI9845340.1 T9SS type A sorting domain-containing protein [Flavobacterium pectinovorum]